jgi:hypothetical protein
MIYFAEPVLDALLFPIALVVGWTPQLLPATISLTRAKGARATPIVKTRHAARIRPVQMSVPVVLGLL